jgi:hypothetical protein
MDQDGIYHHDDGSVGCYPSGSSGSMDYDGEISEQKITFDYSMTVNPNVGGDVKDKVEAVEDAFILFLIDKLDCESVTKKGKSAKNSGRRHLKLGKHRKLAVIGINPSPEDVVVGK